MKARPRVFPYFKRHHTVSNPPPLLVDIVRNVECFKGILEGGDSELEKALLKRSQEQALTEYPQIYYGPSHFWILELLWYLVQV